MKQHLTRSLSIKLQSLVHLDFTHSGSSMDGASLITMIGMCCNATIAEVDAL